MLKTEPNIFMGCECAPQNADVILFSAPFDSTTSFRPGARFAGKAIRDNSYGIESYSPYAEKDLYDLKIADVGELELPLGNSARALEMIEARTHEILQNGSKPFMIGGEHLVTLGAVRAVAKKHPDLHILHFDAHADLRDDYLGEKLSHATVMRRAHEILGDGRIFQAGIRSGDADEFAFAAKHTTMCKFCLGGVEKFIRELNGKPVYLSIDLDVLDPSVFPGTGTPEPGGVSFQELHNAVLLLKNSNVVACDVVELSPHYDHSGISTMAACKIIREILMVL
ncbi:MAG: agmatinase [Defluviitaleaceae bacterium]|nr:agmatinase [Defluviitaleaceae bacterium]MCL2263528.1 agmatinase [Defluviitaleaceae bacterium]